MTCCLSNQAERVLGNEGVNKDDSGNANTNIQLIAC
jgi:hypothetical protein